MTKKEFMLQVIDYIPDRKMGWGLKPLIENNLLTPTAFEKLYEIFRQHIHDAYTEVEKFQLKERLAKIEEMRKTDEAQREAELLNLESVFDSL